MVKQGLLAKKFCNLSLPLEVLSSNAGFYIGTTNDTGFPVSRESVEYYPNLEAAEDALADNTFTQRTHP